jgi:RNA polymerase sigma-70 factor (ECF subfamily)
VLRDRHQVSTPAPAWSAEDERALAIAAKTDRAAFGVLYDRYVHRVYGFCARRLRTPEEAEDATSRVFTRALAAMPGYRDDGPSFGAWLFAIARNVVVDELRARQGAGRATPWSENVTARSAPRSIRKSRPSSPRRYGR